MVEIPSAPISLWPFGTGATILRAWAGTHGVRHGFTKEGVPDRYGRQQFGREEPQNAFRHVLVSSAIYLETYDHQRRRLNVSHDVADRRAMAKALGLGNLNEVYQPNPLVNHLRDFWNNYEGVVIAREIVATERANVSNDRLAEIVAAHVRASEKAPLGEGRVIMSLQDPRLSPGRYDVKRLPNGSWGIGPFPRAEGFVPPAIIRAFPDVYGSGFPSGEKTGAVSIKPNGFQEARRDPALRGANETNVRSLLKAYMDNVAKAGLAWDGRPAGPREGTDNDEQRTDQRISMSPALPQRKLRNAVAPEDETIGGWGPAAYFWNAPLAAGGKTVGQSILQDPAELEKFLAVNTKALVETANQHGLDFTQTHRQLDVEWSRLAGAAGETRPGPDNGMPREIKDEIATRAYQAGIDRESYAGNPDFIDGYELVRGGNGEPLGWRDGLQGAAGADLDDAAKIAAMNRRRKIRLDRGIGHPWQAEAALDDAD